MIKRRAKGMLRNRTQKFKAEGGTEPATCVSRGKSTKGTRKPCAFCAFWWPRDLLSCVLVHPLCAGKLFHKLTYHILRIPEQHEGAVGEV